jgi:pimeloyl-ACP methyl ester carboxylesterase
MPTAVIDGITTTFEVLGSGPPLLMFSPGGFDATIAKWSSRGIYKEIKPLDHLPGRYTCIVFDRRESGTSGGRVEQITWGHYAAQGKGLLDHLGYEQAHLMGACMGCPPVLAFAVAHAEMVLSMTLYWPVGGARYRIRGRGRFGQHLAYVQENGLDHVVALAKSDDRGFGEDPRVGPWASVLRHDPTFEEEYRSFDVDRYQLLVSGTARGLFDRDTAPGAEPEDLLALDIPALIVPGQDASHATSAARYLEECLPRSHYWDVPVADQTEENAPARILEFLDSVA